MAHLIDLLPICMSCKKIRNDAGLRDGIGHGISTHSEVGFSRSIRPRRHARARAPDVAAPPAGRPDGQDKSLKSKYLKIS
ncbi:MAG TPA: hypothetical protein PLQ13_11320 [Candidatus Krumholzibacteria bacterium]|nr:hypothetical protein [Candidatus Krumholzibacteria bacterium]